MKYAVFVRATGPTLSAFNAWVMLKGLETLSLRMKAHCDNAIKLAEWLQSQVFVKKVTLSWPPVSPSP